MQGLDIGPDSCKAFSAALKQSRTVLWNGPMGVFERPAFAAGTNHVAQQLADCTAKVQPPSALQIVFCGEVCCRPDNTSICLGST